MLANLEFPKPPSASRRYFGKQSTRSIHKWASLGCEGGGRVPLRSLWVGFLERGYYNRFSQAYTWGTPVFRAYCPASWHSRNLQPAEQFACIHIPRTQNKPMKTRSLNPEARHSMAEQCQNSATSQQAPGKSRQRDVARNRGPWAPMCRFF